MSNEIVRAWYKYPIMLASVDGRNYTTNYTDFDKSVPNSFWADTTVTDLGNGSLSVHKPGYLVCVVPYKSYWTNPTTAQNVVAGTTAKGANAPAKTSK